MKTTVGVGNARKFDLIESWHQFCNIDKQIKFV